MAKTYSISEFRHELATSALYEITEISRALREHIAEHDSSASVVTVARGMLARVQQLSEAADECLGNGDQEATDALYHVVYCRPMPRGARHDAEVFHG